MTTSYADFCHVIACNECAVTPTTRQKCVQAADAGMCASFANEVAARCPMVPNTVASCGSILAAVRTLCGPVDAGS